MRTVNGLENKSISKQRGFDRFYIVPLQRTKYIL